MSAGGAFGGTRGSRPVPPEKGVFPLDHMHECDVLHLPQFLKFAKKSPFLFGIPLQEKKEYLGCLKTSGHKSDICRHFSKKYLECRMEKNLMAKQDMSELGFRKEYEKEASEGKDDDKRINN